LVTLSTKKEAREREQKLMEHADKMAVQIEKNIAALQQIERSLSGLEDEMKDMRERLRGA
jgi:predicted transcriptional regulator